MAQVMALVHYYAREGYHRSLQTVCTEVIRKRGGDPVLTPPMAFWRCYGMLTEGSYQEVRRAT